MRWGEKEKEARCLSHHLELAPGVATRLVLTVSSFSSLGLDVVFCEPPGALSPSTVSFACFVFLHSTDHPTTGLGFIYCTRIGIMQCHLLKCKAYKGKGFGLHCSLLYLQSLKQCLAHARCSINICCIKEWMNKEQ